MLLRGAPYRCAVRLARPSAGLAGLILALALAGWGAVEPYRSLSGVNENDPDPETAPFTQNLAAGEEMPYPNLASVPPPPISATSKAERQKLTQTLVAERTDTQSNVAAPPGPAAPTAAGQPAAGSPLRGVTSVTPMAPTPGAAAS